MLIASEILVFSLFFVYIVLMLSKSKELPKGVSTLKQLRLEAALSIAELSRLANIDRKTVENAEEGLAVRDAKAAAILRALSQQLSRDIELSEVENLNIL